MVEADIPAFIADSDLKALPTGAEQLAIALGVLRDRAHSEVSRIDHRTHRRQGGKMPKSQSKLQLSSISYYITLSDCYCYRCITI